MQETATEKTWDKFRLFGFSDAVFAIAITLLVLDLKLPENNADLFSRVTDIYPNLLSFFISFAVIGLYWLNHNSIFRYIKKHTRTLFSYNLIFLLFITILPFTTSTLSAHGDTPQAVLVYAGNLVCLGLSLYFIWQYAAQENLLHEDLTKDFIKKESYLLLAVPTVFLVSIPVAYFISPTAGELFWLLNIIVPNHIKKRSHNTNRETQAQ